MGIDTIADIITSIRNDYMDKKGVVRIASTNITDNIVKILLREGFIENARKHRENNKAFLVITLRHRRNSQNLFRTYRHRKRLNFRRISKFTPEGTEHDNFLSYGSSKNKKNHKKSISNLYII